MNDFYEALKMRRTRYGLSNVSTISDKRIEEIVGKAIMDVPSAFNSQSGRVVVLFGEKSMKLWDITKSVMKNLLKNDEAYKQTEAKLNGFAAGYGTILFFEDQAVVEFLQNGYPTYKDNFPIWSNQSNGMLQFAVWTGLAVEGMGASLQHYNPLIDDEVHRAFGIPQTWKLTAEMPFGKPTTPLDAKTFIPLSERIMILK